MLIPGNNKVGGIGAQIDIVLGGWEDGWDYDAMDTMTVSISNVPKADEILLAIAYLGGSRPNAFFKGNPPEKVAALVAQLRTS